MGLASEFKAFIMRGNVVDLAVGVVIGAAFGKIVSTLVDKVFMPAIGLLTGGYDVSGFKVGYKDAQIGLGAVAQATIDFIIVGACLFLVVKLMNKFKKKEEAAPAEPSATEKLLAEIRDELKKRPA
ncbi:MAG: large conductance mechanosensitive channel protein MscL [Planctomycetia bacterium]|nr:large conductance mechanosensitive channel protein MscL [Planctomycetia bacterium]